MKFVFTISDLATPASFLETLCRMDISKINNDYYAQPFYQCVTNQGHFDSDSWYDLSFDIGSREELQSFLHQLAHWHAKNDVHAMFLPNILLDSAENTPWVKKALEEMHFIPDERLERTSDISSMSL